jgi:hypothetical protein
MRDVPEDTLGKSQRFMDTELDKLPERQVTFFLDDIPDICKPLYPFSNLGTVKAYREAAALNCSKIVKTERTQGRVLPPSMDFERASVVCPFDSVNISLK